MSQTSHGYDMATLANMSTDQLHALNSDVVRMIKIKDKMRAQIVRDALKTGDRVRLILDNLRPRDRARFEGQTLIVETVKVSKATCRDEDGRLWNLPIGLLDVL